MSFATEGINSNDFKIVVNDAEQGVVSAQFKLGSMYYFGEGVPVDFKLALKWLSLAAEQGDVDAQHNLGVMYKNGQGIPEDKVQAYAWYNIAASNGEEKSEVLGIKLEKNCRLMN